MVFVDILWKTPKKYIQNIRKSSHRWPGHPSTKDLAAILGTTEVQEKSGEPTVAWDRETSTVDIAWGSKKIACFNGWWMMTCDEILWIVGCIRASLLPMRITRCRHSDSEENRIHWLWEISYIRYAFLIIHCNILQWNISHSSRFYSRQELHWLGISHCIPLPSLIFDGPRNRMQHFTVPKDVKPSLTKKNKLIMWPWF